MRLITILKAKYECGPPSEALLLRDAMHGTVLSHRKSVHLSITHVYCVHTVRLSVISLLYGITMILVFFVSTLQRHDLQI